MNWQKTREQSLWLIIEQYLRELAPTEDALRYAAMSAELEVEEFRALVARRRNFYVVR